MDPAQVKLVFPNCHYEDWDSRWWAKGYPDIFRLQQKTLLTRAQSCYKDCQQWRAGREEDTTMMIECELCRVWCKGPDEFVAHCCSNDRHKELERVFTGSQYDYLFEGDGEKAENAIVVTEGIRKGRCQ